MSSLWPRLGSRLFRPCNMQDYQKGDVRLSIGEHSYTLRLTLGALCEISERLGVSGPIELAEELRFVSADKRSAHKARLLLECLLRPRVSCAVDIPSLAASADPKVFMPVLARLFEKNFT